MKLYFVRHGQSEANINHQISNRGYLHGLTEKGRGQSATLAQALLEKEVSRIYTSPLRRAVETAQIIGNTLAVPYEITGALREFDCGIAEEGMDDASWGLWDWVWNEWHVYGRLDSKIEGGESFLDLQARLYPFARSLAAGEDGGSAVLIGHGGLFTAVLPGLMANETQIREQVSDLSFANTAYALAEMTPIGLACREWCGTKI